MVVHVYYIIFPLQVHRKVLEIKRKGSLVKRRHSSMSSVSYAHFQGTCPLYNDFLSSCGLGARLGVDRVLDSRQGASLKAGEIEMRYTIRIDCRQSYRHYVNPRRFTEDSSNKAIPCGEKSVLREAKRGSSGCLFPEYKETDHLSAL